jgi:phage gp29-like protein
MTATRGLIQSVKGWLSKPIATPQTDPNRFFSNLMTLPNPDPILRKMGRAEQVYQAILLDPHVIGEVRSIRGSFRSHQYRLEVGQDNDSKAAAALELCEQWMQTTRPNPVSDWLEVMWQMSASVLTGYAVHELVFDLVDGKYLPTQVLDRPAARLRFNADGAPMLISKGDFNGKPVEPWQFIVSRHMATMSNPYGLALLSACFWAWTFKTGGWGYFVKYCERHGLPWPVGRYPVGTNDADQDKLAEALASMVDAGYVVAQDGTGLELLTPSSSGSNLPQERLITLCNREMSKALTSQAMVGEALEVGSRAASVTAQDRQNSVHDSDRDIAAAGMNQLFKWITLFNFGDGVSPPTLEFFKQEAAGKDRAEAYQLAANMGGRPSRKAMLEELDMPAAEDDADALLPQAKAAPAPTNAPGNPTDDIGAPTINLSAIAGMTFAKAAGMTEQEAMDLASEAADQAIEDKMIAPVYQLLTEYESQGKTLADFKAALEDVIGSMDDEALREVLDRALSYGMLRGAATGVA